jgi:hypothetical protein
MAILEHWDENYVQACNHLWATSDEGKHALTVDDCDCIEFAPETSRE